GARHGRRYRRGSRQSGRGHRGDAKARFRDDRRKCRQATLTSAAVDGTAKRKGRSARALGLAANRRIIGVRAQSSGPGERSAWFAGFSCFPMAEAPHLSGRIGRFQLFALGFGSIIGSAWVVILNRWLAEAGPVGAILGFVAGGIAVVCIGA